MSSTETLTRDDVFEALREVIDPELGMDVVELGLIYDVEVGDNGALKIEYSLTTPACPAGPQIKADIDGCAAALPGVTDVVSELTFDPPWTPERMSDDAKFILGIG